MDVIARERVLDKPLDAVYSAPMPNLTAEQLADKRNYIGGSKVAAILGWSPWESPKEVWEWYVGLKMDKLSNAAMSYGHYAETAIAGFYAETTGRTVWENPATFYAPGHMYMGCVLGQHDDSGKKEQAIYYLSKKFTACEMNYSMLERTCCALVWAS